MSQNGLSGSIPPTLARLRELFALDVSNNVLTGKIPVGSQMDTMDDPTSYANNSGLCGMQIYVPCSVQEPSTLAGKFPSDSEQEEANGKWFLLAEAGFGYSVGFFLTVGIMYFRGHINIGQAASGLKFNNPKIRRRACVKGSFLLCSV